MRQGYFSPPVVIILALITLTATAVIYFNRDLILKSKKDQQAQQTAATPSPKPSPSLYSSPFNEEFEINSGAIYKNEEVGVQFKAPVKLEIGVTNAWTYRSEGIGKIIRLFYYRGNLNKEDAFFTHLNEGLVMDIVQIKNNNNSLEELAIFYSVPSLLEESAKASLNGKNGYKISHSDFKGGPVTQASYFFEVDGKTYMLYAEYRGFYKSEYENTFNQILSTFQFLD